MTAIYILLGLSLAVSAACLLLLIRNSVRKNTPAGDFYDLKNEIRIESDRLKNDVGTVLKMNNEMVTGALNSQSQNVEKALSKLAEAEGRNTQIVEMKFAEFRLSVEQKLDKLREENAKSLNEVRADNEKQLGKMRETVDEKLTATLDQRFSESFKLVAERLDTIKNSFAELQNLQNGVNDMKKIFANIKTRGTWGEVALDNLLSQVLTPEQYSKSVNITKTENERVDFVINLPGKNDERVYLPLDAKFPVEDYQRLVEASEKGDSASIDEASKAIERRIKSEAQSIRDKYIHPPKTTDFAVMYLPVEGLFAEVVKKPGLAEELQNRFRVVVCGPTTLAALLNSLQMGFRTVAIEKRSTEIWKLLATFQKDFATFSELLVATKKKLEGVTNSIDDANKRTDLIRKRLSKVESIPGTESFSDEAFNLLGEKSEDNND